ncbi:hypothetical protein Ciccas_001370 [Cichlidogyrus casuarinus]|uniref:Cell division cycle protein 123 homolog n=1 Tax=Cichlidogyrus casuarinus TaxID=1844966 RepID=A0ABD2QLD3_9PLAT
MCKLLSFITIVLRFKHKAIDTELSESESSSDEETEYFKEFPVLEEKINKKIENLGGEAFVKLNWSSPKDAAWINFGNTLKCSNYDETLLLLKSSDFIAHDIKHSHDFCEGKVEDLKSHPKILVLREWRDIRAKDEFRCFVKRRQLFAISQRRIDSAFLELQKRQKMIQNQIMTFFEENLAAAFPLLSYTFDVICDEKDEVTLVDFNVYGDPTEPLLFTYAELNDFSRRQYSKDVIMFRLQRDEKINLKSNEMNAYKFPLDITSLCNENISEISSIFNQGLRVVICTKINEFLLREHTLSDGDSLQSDINFLFLLVGVHLSSLKESEVKDSHSATKIQALWRGYLVRRNLSKANDAISILQSIIRRRIKNKRIERSAKEAAEELCFKITLSRKKRYREALERELKLIKTLPISITKNYEFTRKNEAAFRLQAFFRGVRERRMLREGNLTRIKAARVLQRAWRKKMSRRDLLELRGGPSRNWLLNHLTKAQKHLAQQLNDEVTNRLKLEHEIWSQENTKIVTSKEELQQLHQRTHDMLKKRLFLRAKASFQCDRLQAIEKRAKADLEILSSEMTWDENKPERETACSRLKSFVDNYDSKGPKRPTLHCNVQSIASLAKSQHNDKIASLSEHPWRISYQRWLEYCQETLQPTEERLEDGVPYWKAIDTDLTTDPQILQMRFKTEGPRFDRIFLIENQESL